MDIVQKEIVEKGEYCMKQLELAICDSNAEDVHTLEEYILQIVPHAKIKKYVKGNELLRDLKEEKHKYRAVFLGICMEEQNGIDVARDIRRLDGKLPIIFTTYSDEYYREAFDVFAFQYILKPVSYTKIKKIMDRLGETKGDSDERTVHFRYRSRIYTLGINEITYVSSSLHTVNFYLANGERLHCRGKLGDFEEQFRDTPLVRCHQSFYVNLDAVVGMKSDSFMLKDQEIPVSRTYMKEAQQKYQCWLKKK